MDRCEICGGDLFMVPSGDLTCLNRCRYVEPTKEQFRRLVGDRVQTITNQLRELGKAVKKYNELFDD